MAHLSCRNVGAIIVESVPWIGTRYAAQLYAFEVFSVAVFTVEYLLRIWSAPDLADRRYAEACLLYTSPSPRDS